MDRVILLQDHHRVVYRNGSLVHKKRLIGLEYEYMVGQYLNRLNHPHCVRTLGYEPGRLTTEYIPGPTWFQLVQEVTTPIEQLQTFAGELFQTLETLPFTHYDLHMNNVILPEDRPWQLIDFGFSAIPATEWVSGTRYIEATHTTLSCGIFPSVLDPGYDRMVALLNVYKQAKRAGLMEVVRYCVDALQTAEFTHPRFPGYEHFLPLDQILEYRNLFYPDRMPLLASSTAEISQTRLLDGLEELKQEALIYLMKEHQCSLNHATLMLTDIRVPHALEQWVQQHEERVYGLLYSYKRRRIADRRMPSISSILDIL